MLKNALLAGAVALAPTLVWPAVSPLTTVQFAASQALRLTPIDPTPEIARMFSRGKAADAAELQGWISGRRFSAKGPVAALLVGQEVYTAAGEKVDAFDDPNSPQLQEATQRWDRQDDVEIRRSGKIFVARYSNGDYGYFFKKVR